MNKYTKNYNNITYIIYKNIKSKPIIYITSKILKKKLNQSKTNKITTTTFIVGTQYPPIINVIYNYY